MANLLERLNAQHPLGAPKWLPDNTHYLCSMGSTAYGVEREGGGSDRDVYGFTLPPLELIWPHLSGEIPGFGRQLNRFEQFQAHHLLDTSKSATNPITWDLSIYSIVKFFQLAMENNPNMVDALFVPQDCVLHCTAIGQMMRESRKTFLHKGSFHKLKGYSYSQKSKMLQKVPTEDSSRYRDWKQYGFCLKAAYHTVRLLLQCEQILIEHDLDLRRHSAQLKAIRAGEWSADQVVEFFNTKEKSLEDLYGTSTLRHSPDEPAIKALLYSCLEQHYGNLSNVVPQPNRHQDCCNAIRKVLDQYGV